MNILRPACALLLPLLMVAAVRAAPPTEEEIRTAVGQLGDEKFAVRERAMKLLWAAGPAAEKALREVAESRDLEVRRRARLLLDRINYRIGPETPPEVIALMQRYRNGKPEEQSDVLKEMLKIGSKAHPYLLRLLEAVELPERGKILDQFAYDDWKILVPLMADGQEDLVEQLLEKAAAAQIASVAPHFASYFAITNKLPARIAKQRASVEKLGGAFEASLLAALYRQGNDPDGVLWAAERASQAELVRIILMERGQWSELLTRYTPPLADGFNRVNGLGLTAAYQRLAGRNAEFAETVKKIEEFAAVPRNPVTSAARALLINECPQPAIDVLVRGGQPQQAAELLCTRGQLTDARTMSETAAKAEVAQNYYARAYHIALLLKFGDQKGGREWLAALAKDMAGVTDVGWLDRQIDIEAKVGLAEQAERHLLERVERNDPSPLSFGLKSLFPELGLSATTIWRSLRHRHSTESAGDTLKRLRRFEERTVAADELAALIRAVPDSEWLPQGHIETAFDHLATVVQRFGRDDLAVELLKSSGWEKAPPTVRLRLADTLAKAAKWPAAAAAYRSVWESDRSAPLPYFLHGAALSQSGQVDAGKVIMAKAHRMLLGGDSARQYFCEALLDRGFVADARQEVAIRARLCQPERPSFDVTLSHSARLAQENGDYSKAASLSELYLVRMLANRTSLKTIGAYLRVTATVHALRAKALLAQGKKDEALREIARSEQLNPGLLELPILLVADLEKAGEKDAAARLFNRLYQTLERNCRDFPNCADAHNQLGWLAVRCRRNFDEALSHARKANELDPRSPSFQDTLAEILFQRGEKAKAIEMMKKCVTQPSDRAGYYWQQLRRFEEGDPLTEPATAG